MRSAEFGMWSEGVQRIPHSALDVLHSSASLRRLLQLLLTPPAVMI
jgi:hypothetical protein